MKSNNAKIRSSTEPKIPIKAISIVDEKEQRNSPPIISFVHFKGYSIQMKGFNNNYQNQVKSVAAAYHFIDKIKNIQQKTIGELFDKGTKHQLHCHPIEDEREVSRINDVLLNGYEFSQKMVENFENSYFEFSLDNGSRVIFVKVNNIFELLFIDNNHMIYKESSRFLKHKDSYEFPSCLGKINFERDYEEKSIIDVIRIMVEAYENREFNDLEDFVKNLMELIEDVDQIDYKLQTQ